MCKYKVHKLYQRYIFFFTCTNTTSSPGHCCCTLLHLAAHSIWEKGGQKWDIWRLVQEIAGVAPVCILELCAGDAEHSSVHSIHPNWKLQPVLWDTDKAVIMIVLPLTTSAKPGGYQRTFVTCVNSEGGMHQYIKPPAVVDLLCRKRVILSQP